MAEVIWTESALTNLEDVAEYIALSNLNAAQKLVKRVFGVVDRLEQLPLSGKVPRELDEFDYREVVVNPLRIFYKIQDDKVYVLFVMRQEQELRRFILNEN